MAEAADDADLPDGMNLPDELQRREDRLAAIAAANDKQQLTPMLERLGELPQDLPKPAELTADAGYFSEANVDACEQASLEPSIAITRDKDHPHWSQRFESPPAPPAEAGPVERMNHRLKTPAGRATYALRKQTVEPVFGIFKSVLGFRQFPTRGLDNVQNEWTQVCVAWNLNRMAALRPQ